MERGLEALRSHFFLESAMVRLCQSVFLWVPIVVRKRGAQLETVLRQGLECAQIIRALGIKTVVYSSEDGYGADDELFVAMRAGVKIRGTPKMWFLFPLVFL